jgi:hypothetical protein
MSKLAAGRFLIGISPQNGRDTLTYPHKLGSDSASVAVHARSPKNIGVSC